MDFPVSINGHQLQIAVEWCAFDVKPCHDISVMEKDGEHLIRINQS